MLKRIPIRWRLTLMTSALIALCCIGLNVVLSLSAYQMADVVGAALTQPACSVGEEAALYLEPATVVPAADLEFVDQAKHGYGVESLGYTVIAVLCGGALTYCVSGRALRPVRILNEQVRNIDAHNLSETMEVPPTRDEIAQLTESFNSMTEKLALTFAAQRRFSADAAHELRTPLAVLQTKLDVFRKREDHTPEEYDALLASFQKQLSHLRSLVTELLAIANMEESFDRRDVSLRELLEDVSAELAPVAEKKGVAVSLQVADVHICGNPDLLFRVFYNLVENGIKYNVPQGSVWICASAEGGQSAVVTVDDTGIGIPASSQKQIFEPFYRVDASRNRDRGGAGLGLPLAAAIVQKHGGTVTAAHRDGGGTRFTVVLPK